MNLLAVDAGRSEVEVMSKKGICVFPSVVAPVYKELNNPANIKNDLEIHMDGKKWFVGDLADREGSRSKRNNFGESKVNEILRVQIAAAAIYAGLSTSKEIELGILVPITDFTKTERKKLTDLLHGTYTGTYWLVKEAKKEPKKKTFTFEIGKDIVISPEGVAAYWSDPQEEDTQTLDFGAQTINFCFHRFKDGGATFIEDFSGTITDGWETLKESNKGIKRDNLADIIANTAIERVNKLGWSKDLKTQVFGGAAEFVYPYIKEAFPYAELGDVARNANVIGLYNYMEEVVVNV